MIRFSCPHCGREYVLGDYMARLPLLCKGCGQRLDVPEPQPEVKPQKPEPQTPRADIHRPAVPAKQNPVVDPRGSPATLTPWADPADVAARELLDDFLSQETLAKLDLPLEVDRPPDPAIPVPAMPVKPLPVKSNPATITSGSPQSGSRKWLALGVDVAVAVVLLGGGVLLGELAVRKPTREVLANASGPKFPPTDLLVWLGCPVLLLLIYAWLGTRGWTVGGWLKRRSGG